MGKISEILQAAQARVKSFNLPYAGALLPYEAHVLMGEAPAARLIDVRSQAERDLVGMIPGAINIEWQVYPGWSLSPHFLTQLKQQVDRESLAMFICRSGGVPTMPPWQPARRGMQTVTTYWRVLRATWIKPSGNAIS